MIYITENKSVKCVGETSLRITFEFDYSIVQAVKSVENGFWLPKETAWEFPLSKLAQLIDVLTYLDDITLSVLDDENKEQLTQQVIHQITPYAYQNDGINWIINNKSGLLTDAPGLGKSLQVIYAAEELKKQKGIKHCLIVCGVNSLKQNWKKEITKCSSETVRIIGEKISKKGKIGYTSVAERVRELFDPIDEFFVITNIQLFQDKSAVDAILNSKNSFDMIVCDEIHKVTPKSMQGKNFQKLSGCADYMYGLTGTLLTNSPLDAYVPLKFIGKEKACFSTFRNFYCNIEYEFGHQVLRGYKNINILKDELSECSLRRTKDLLDLPPKTIVKQYVEMDSSQSNFYSNIESGVLEEADRVNIKSSSLLGLVVRLRQATTCPEMLTTQKIHNAKIERCLELVDEITSAGDKVVIFSMFKSPLYTLYDELKQYKPLICTGDQDEMTVSQNIDIFQTDPSNKVLLCTEQKLGTGVTLTAASYVIFLDCPWVPSEFEQCCDRCWRIGSSKPVTIYTLIIEGTIDERVQNILDTKKGIADYVVDDVINTERADLMKLLGLTQSID